MPNTVITVTDRKLFTLYPDGTDLVELQEPSEYSKNSIGERKRIELSYNASDSIIESGIYFNPALFLESGSPSPAPNIPTLGWMYYVVGTITPGTYNMALVVPASYNSGLIKNWTAKFVFIDNNNFKILFEYFQLYDLGGYLNPGNENNYLKLITPTLTDPNVGFPPPSVSADNVYQSATVVPQFYIYIQNLGTGVDGYLNYEFADYSAGFYNKNPVSASPYFSLPVWELELNGSPVTTLQLSGQTKVTFGITAPGVVDKIFIWLIKTSSRNNATDFITNYDASYLNVVTNAGTGTLDNKIIAPSTEPTLVSGKYEVSFYVDETTLAYGETYRMIAVVYESGYGQVDVNSFISDEYSITDLPRFVGTNYEFTGSITDYDNTYYGNDLIAVVEERLKSTLTVDYDYNVFSDDMLNRLGLVVTNDIREYLTKITVEVYENDGTYINYFERLVATQVDPVTYNIPAGLTLDFTSGYLQIDYDFRNRYESGVLNLETILIAGNVLINPPIANQNWAGRDLFIKYSLELFYDDYSTPFSDTIIFEQKIHPKDYANIGINKVVQGSDFGVPITDTDYFCSDEESVCLVAILSGVLNPENYNLITTFEPLPGNSSTLDEHEEYTGVLPQLTSEKIFTQDVSFTAAGLAEFCIIPTKFFINLPYKISAIAKQMAVCERITEEGFLRLEEDGEIRIMETC